MKGVIFDLDGVLIDSRENMSYAWSMVKHHCKIDISFEKYFDENIFNLMDFDCDQRESVHFFYTLPFSKKKALIESTWLSKMNDDSQKDYDQQIKEYIENHLIFFQHKKIFFF